ncbi:MAG: hypothetical protein R2731_09745 [Nocardioides sp.]
MTRILKTTATLLVLLLGVGVAGAWSWQALTKPFPKSEEPPVCVETPSPPAARSTPTS